MHSAFRIRNVTVTLTSPSGDMSDVFFVSDIPKEHLSLSHYIDLTPGPYYYKVRSTYEWIYGNGSITLEHGGVYTLVIREYRETVDVSSTLGVDFSNCWWKFSVCQVVYHDETEYRPYVLVDSSVFSDICRGNNVRNFRFGIFLHTSSQVHEDDHDCCLVPFRRLGEFPCHIDYPSKIFPQSGNFLNISV